MDVAHLKEDLISFCHLKIKDEQRNTCQKESFRRNICLVTIQLKGPNGPLLLVGGKKNTKDYNLYSNVGRLFCTPAPPKFTKKLAVDSFFNFGS